MNERSYRWFHVRALPPRRGRKTRVYEVRAASDGALLGTISWYAPWRQFAFAPQPNAVWSRDCLTDVADAVAAAHVAHRKQEP